MGINVTDSTGNDEPAETLVALAETLAALANGQGGTLKLVAKGEQTAALVDQILQAALSTDPPLILPLPVPLPTLSPESGQMVAVTVPAGLPHVYAVLSGMCATAPAASPVGPSHIASLGCQIDHSGSHGTE